MQAIQRNGAGLPLSKTWRECMGAGAAQAGLRADWQRQLGQVVQQCGFQGARMTGLGPLGQQGWQALDMLGDYLTELEVLPVWRVNGPEGPFELASLIRHCIARYGVGRVRHWRFELPMDERYGLRRQALKTLDDGLNVGVALTLSRLRRFLQDQEADFVTVCGAPDAGQFQQARRVLSTSGRALPLHWDAVRAAYGMDDALHMALRLAQLHLTDTLSAESLALSSFSGLCNEGAYMIDAYGVQQPSGHAYRMLAALGDTELDRGPGWVTTQNAQGRLRALAWTDPANPPSLQLSGFRPGSRVMTETLDAAHGWVYPVWRQMGCPEVLSRYQTQALRHAALHTDVAWHQADLQGRLEWRMPGPGDALVLLKES